MKLLLKVNRGLILTAAVVLAVVVYLIVVFFVHRAEEPAIKDLCNKYLQTSVSYSMLPKQYRAEKPDMPKAELDSYISKMSREIGAFYPQKGQYKDAVTSQYKADLESQSKGLNIVYNYTKSIVKFQSIDFDGDTATVTILTNATYDGPNGAYKAETTGSARTSVTGQTTDTVSLAKLNGEWKITYANIQPPAQGGGKEVSYGATVTVG